MFCIWVWHHFIKSFLEYCNCNTPNWKSQLCVFLHRPQQFKKIYLFCKFRPFLFRKNLKISWIRKIDGIKDRAKLVHTFYAYYSQLLLSFTHFVYFLEIREGGGHDRLCIHLHHLPFIYLFFFLSLYLLVKLDKMLVGC